MRLRFASTPEHAPQRDVYGQLSSTETRQVLGQNLDAALVIGRNVHVHVPEKRVVPDARNGLPAESCQHRLSAFACNVTLTFCSYFYDSQIYPHGYRFTLTLQVSFLTLNLYPPAFTDTFETQMRHRIEYCRNQEKRSATMSEGVGDADLAEPPLRRESRRVS